MKLIPLNELKPKKSSNFSFIENLKKSFELDKENSTHKSIEGYYSISSFTGNACLRKIYYKQKYPEHKPFSFAREFVFDVGHAVHELIQSKMSKFNYLHGVEEFFQDDERKICGSTDGYYINHQDKTIRMLDIKTTNLGGFTYVTKSRKAKKDHIHQLSMYAYYVQQKHPDYKIISMHILYVNKNQADHKHDYSLLKTNIQHFDEDHQETVFRHLSDIESTFDGEDVQLQEIIFQYDPSIVEEEFEKVRQLQWKIDNNKLPNKISKKIYCLNCPFVEMCRGKEWVEANK